MRQWTWMVVLGGAVSIALPGKAQTPPVTPTPIVIGRDLRETREVIGKNFLLRVWLSDVGGAGVQQIRAARVDVDGNIAMKGLPATKAEGVTVAALEQQVMAVYKASTPTAQAWISVIDRTPPAPPPPPPPPPPAPPAPSAPATAPVATTQATTQPGAQPAATQPATKPAS